MANLESPGTNNLEPEPPRPLVTEVAGEEPHRWYHLKLIRCGSHGNDDCRLASIIAKPFLYNIDNKNIGLAMILVIYDEIAPCNQSQ